MHELLHCDFFDYDLQKAGEFDFQLTDPPYSKWTQSNTLSSTPYEDIFWVRAKEYRYDSLTPELVERVSAMASYVSGWSLVFTDTKSINLWHYGLQKAQATWRSDLIWHRWSSPVPGNLKPPHRYELVVATCATPCIWNGPGNWDGFDAKCLRGSEKWDGEKPLDLALEAVKLFSNPGDRGFDGCAGAGTFLIAAYLLDRPFVALERSAEAFSYASERWALVQRGELSKRDAERVARFLMKHPDEADRILPKVGGMAALAGSFRAISRELEKAKRDLVLTLIGQDTKRDYEKLIRAIYEQMGPEVSDPALAGQPVGLDGYGNLADPAGFTAAPDRVRLPRRRRTPA